MDKSKKPGGITLILSIPALAVIFYFSLALAGKSLNNNNKAAGTIQKTVNRKTPKQLLQFNHPSLPPVKPEVIYHGSRKQRYIALTFDACEPFYYKTGYDKNVIDILLKSATPATLFLGGKWMLSHQEDTIYLSKIPYFELANHSYSHPDLRKLSDRDIIFQINKTQEIMYKLTGSQGRLFRSPFGYFNKRVVKIAGDLGLEVIQWDVVSGDPDRRVSVSMIKRFVLKGTKNGSIIIMHMNKKGYNTYKALPFIIEELKKRGFQFVTVSRLLELEKNHKSGINNL